MTDHATDHQHTVLVLDDLPDVAAMLAECLGDDPGVKWLVHQSHHPVEALALARELEGLDLVLTDFNMPVMNGVEFADALRSSGYSGPIVLVTAGAGKSARIPDDVRSHVTEILNKPYGLDQLYGLTHRLMGL